MDRLQKAVAQKPESFRDLIKKDLPDVPYWLNPILPKTGKLLIGGEAKIGKSWTMLELIGGLASGKAPFGMEDDIKIDEPVDVLYVEAELGENQLQSRALAGLANRLGDEELERITYCSKDHNVVLSEKSGQDYLMDVIDQSGAKVLVLDPMQKLHFYKENDATEMGQLFHYLDYVLETFREERHLGIVFVHHYKKPPTISDDAYDPLSPYNFRGTTRWFDDPDCIITMERLQNLRTNWISFRNKARFTFRGDGNIDEQYFVFNEQNDLRMLSGGPVDGEPAPRDTAPLVQPPRNERGFAPG